MTGETVRAWTMDVGLWRVTEQGTRAHNARRGGSADVGRRDSGGEKGEMVVGGGPRQGTIRGRKRTGGGMGACTGDASVRRGEDLPKETWDTCMRKQADTRATG